MKEFFGYALAFLATLGGVEIFRRWSLRKELFDVPNERSSHTVPTPRGGGLIIVIVCLSAYIIATFFLGGGGFQWSYLLGACSIALVSWIDDLYTISSVWRFAVHIGSALLAIFTLGYFDEIYLPGTETFNLGVIGAVLTFFWIVWLTNAYNFMDGIDGIAGMQAVTAGIGWVLLGNISGAPASGFYGGIIASGGLGFLILNWQPAKIFMGDVGSAFLGYTFAVLPLMAKNEPELNAGSRKFLFPAALLLIWLFAFDTLWTFGKRILKREKVWQAHRSHLYQRLVISGLSHTFVSVLYGAISVLNVILLISLVTYILPNNFLMTFVVLQSIGLLLMEYFYRIEKK